MSPAQHVAYCPHCRARVGSPWSCLCGSWLPSAWLLVASFALGAVSVALGAIVEAVLFDQVASVYRGLGASLPFGAPIFFALARPIAGLGAAFVLVAPLAALAVGRTRAAAAARLVRRSLAVSILLACWALGSLALWYAVVRATIDVLR